METIMIVGVALVVIGALAIVYARTQERAGFERGVASTAELRAQLEERVNARDVEIARLAGAQTQATLEAHAKDAEVRRLSIHNAQLAEQLDAERRTSAEKTAFLEQAQDALKNSFEALSAQVLQTNNRAFLDLAQETLGKHQQTATGDLEKRQQAIAELVTPVKTSLERLDGRINEIESKREGAYGALMTTVRMLQDGQSDLRRETGNLTKALRQPAARGHWGEMQLRNAVEAAGMLAHCDFVEQVTVTGEDGRLRPDLVVRLPGGGQVVVDAKVPLLSFLEAVECEDEAACLRHLADHTRQLRDHIAKLGRKSYHEQFEQSPELVVLFLSSEAHFSAALRHDPSLIEYGAREKVVVATPTTLIALLRTCALAWKQEALARNAREISDLGRQLYERIATMAAHWARMGKNLSEAVEAYNGAVGSMESRVLVSARRFLDLDVAPEGKPILDLAQIEVRPRMLQAPEVTAEAA
ncbi:MAG: DNA recombination protein RmuC [Burkholderiales bacterium]